MPAVMVAVPTAVELLEYLQVPNPSPDAITSAYAVLDVVERAARGYTRGRGFDVDTDTCAEDLAAAIITAAGRRFGNPHGKRSETIGSYTAQWGSHEWDLAERQTLDRWRQRVA